LAKIEIVTVLALTKNKTFIYTLLGILYALGAGYMFKNYGAYHYVYLLLPFILFVIYYALFDLKKIYYLTIIITPLAITLRTIGLSSGTGTNLSLPSEPLLFGLMCLFIMNLAYGRIVEKEFNRHVITSIIFAQLIWMAFTIITSSMPLVSFKAFVSRLWFLIPFYFFTNYFIKDNRSVLKVFLAYTIPLCIICIYTTIKHAAINFDDEKGDWVMAPFYNDHTAYGAAIAMFIFPAIFSLFLKDINKNLKILFAVCVVILGIALYLSFARASWLGAAAAILIYITLLLKIRFKVLLTLFASGLIIFLLFSEQIFIVLNRNDQDSKEGAANHIESITNVKTDASNVERINRWNCAIRMFNERPIFGWGPGTYQFQYGPFQKFSERTIISTNEGDGGNCHSEYLGPLAEQGVFGCIIMLILMIATFGVGYKTYFDLKAYNDKLIFASIFLGLVTYYLHGFLNNFLDTEKLSVPFWCFMALMVYYSIKSKKQISNPASKT
jgi:putative inorganic carbon (hco3(-)) transporter